MLVFLVIKEMFIVLFILIIMDMLYLFLKLFVCVKFGDNLMVVLLLLFFELINFYIWVFKKLWEGRVFFFCLWLLLNYG